MISPRKSPLIPETTLVRRRFLTGGAAIAGAAAAGFAAAADLGRARTVSIFHTTDLHGRVMPTSTYEGLDDVGGFARCASCIRQWRRESPHSLTVDVGDVVQGTAFSFADGGVAMIELFNRLGYDAWTLGNHDFDWGPEKLGTMLERSTAPVLTANLARGATVPGGFEGAWTKVAPWTIRDVGGFRIGLVGLITPGLPFSLPPELLDGTDVTDPRAALQAAVAAFQTQSGLNPDAVVGQRTVAALNLGDAERLAAVTVALERERWLNFDRGARHIWVNLADFSAKVIDAGEITFETETVVGAVLREKQTPEFSDLMRYLEVNPDWTVPPGVVRRDYLPTLQEDPTALAHLMLVDADGQPVAREAVDFRAYTARTFPYMLRQPPGDTNALGLVKFMFPNRHAIYLHDTPEKHLFARDSRTYSSGCVRLQDPFGLAHVLLARQSATPEADFRRALDSGRQVRINLKDPVPIHIDYRTAFFGADGVLRFRPDVYGRDRLVHEALLDAGLASRGVDG